MIVKIQRQLFDSLPNETIGHTCFEPLVPVYQNNIRKLDDKDVQEYKATFYKSLTKGQQALFMFFTFYDHAIKSEFEFYRMSDYYQKSHTLSAVKKGVTYFEDSQMSQLFTDLEDLISTGDKTGRDDDPDYLESNKKLYLLFQKITPNTIRRIGECIKNNPLEFIQFE